MWSIKRQLRATCQRLTVTERCVRYWNDVNWSHVYLKKLQTLTLKANFHPKKKGVPGPIAGHLMAALVYLTSEFDFLESHVWKDKHTNMKHGKRWQAVNRGREIFTLPSGHAMGQKHPNFELRSGSLATAIQSTNSTGHLKCFVMFHIITTMMTPGMEGTPRILRCLQLCGHTDIGRQIGGIDLVLTANRSLPEANVTNAKMPMTSQPLVLKQISTGASMAQPWCSPKPMDTRKSWTYQKIQKHLKTSTDAMHCNATRPFFGVLDAVLKAWMPSITRKDSRP